MSLTDVRPPKALVNKVIREVGYNKVSILGKFETIYRTIRRHRESSYNPKPYLYESIGISEKLSTTYTNEDFYRYGPDNYQNNIPFNDIYIFF